MSKKGQPIGVFDSGMGGISVLRELLKVLPKEDYIYFGDSKNAPYGSKSLEEVRNLTFQGVEQLLSQGAKGIVVACNTATSAAVRLMREKYPDLPLVGIEPAVKPAATFMEHPKVLVMATPMTIREEKLQKLMEPYHAQADIYPLACPGLMEFVEAGNTDGADLKDFLQELLTPYLDKQLDAVVLGCTHYPFVQKQIREVLGPNVTIFDGGNGTAREMKRRLAEAHLLNEQGTGRVEFQNSRSGEKELLLCERLLREEM